MGPMKRTRQRKNKAAAADWMDVPPELLQLVASKIADIFDFISFRFVCRAWHFSVGPQDIHPQIPWLFLPVSGSPVVSFFNPSTCSIKNLYLPEVKGKRIFGSLHGWLVMIENENLQPEITLINPLTKSQVLLPRLRNIGNTISASSKALLCFNPSQKILVVIWNDDKLFLFGHGGDNWVEMAAPCFAVFGSMTCFDERIYVADDKGRLSVIDIESSMLFRLIDKIPQPVLTYPRLVEERGNLSLIGLVPNSLFQLFSLNRTTEEMKWELVTKGLGDNTLYMTNCQHMLISYPKNILAVSRPQIYYLFYGTDLILARDGDTSVVSIRVRNVMNENMLGDTWMLPSVY